MIVLVTGEFEILCMTRWERAEHKRAGAVTSVYVRHPQATRVLGGGCFAARRTFDIDDDFFPVFDSFSSSPGTVHYVDTAALYLAALGAIEGALSGERPGFNTSDLELLWQLVDRMRAEIALHSLSPPGAFSVSVGIEAYTTKQAGAEAEIWIENGRAGTRYLNRRGEERVYTFSSYMGLPEAAGHLPKSLRHHVVELAGGAFEIR